MSNTGRVNEELHQAAENDGLELKFRSCGEGYERAKMVADKLDVDMKTFLLLCIKEGHLVLKRRVGLMAPEMGDYDEPAILRRPPPTDPKERAQWEQARGLFE